MSLAKYDPVTMRTCHRLSWGTHYSSFVFDMHSIATIDHLSFCYRHLSCLYIYYDNIFCIVVVIVC